MEFHSTSVVWSPHVEEWWPPSQWQRSGAGRSSAHETVRPPPPCKSPPVGCPAWAQPARRNRRAPPPLRCPQSLHESPVGLKHYGAGSSLWSDYPWSTATEQTEWRNGGARVGIREGVEEMHSVNHLQKPKHSEYLALAFHASAALIPHRLRHIF